LTVFRQDQPRSARKPSAIPLPVLVPCYKTTRSRLGTGVADFRSRAADCDNLCPYDTTTLATIRSRWRKKPGPPSSARSRGRARGCGGAFSPNIDGRRLRPGLMRRQIWTPRHPRRICQSARRRRLDFHFINAMRVSTCQGMPSVACHRFRHLLLTRWFAVSSGVQFQRHVIWL